MHSSNTLLVVDDEIPILDVYRSYLAEDFRRETYRTSRQPTESTRDALYWPTYRVLMADSGESAIEIVKQELAANRHIAAGFFDMKLLGGIDGLETIKRIRQLDPLILCTVVTAYQDWSIDTINEIFADGKEDEWDYLSKPFTPNEIRQKARQLVASWNRRRKLELTVQEIRSLNKTLEDRVALRTKALEEKTRDLEKALATVKETEMALIQREKLASLGELSAGIAHEINNPVTYILTNLEETLNILKDSYQFLGQSDSVEKLQRSYDVVTQLTQESQDGVQRLARIARDLKGFTSAHRDKIEPLNITTVLETAIRIIDNKLRHLAVLQRNFGDVGRVMGSDGRLVQVFLNLLSNALGALKHPSTQDNRIEISTKEEGDDVVITVCDNGCGIAKDKIAHVFDLFYTTKPAGEGTGLGLSICKNIVEQNGGSISLISEVGKGTTVTVRLRKAPEEALKAPAPSSPSTAPSKSDLRLLFVDDDRAVLKAHQKRFSRIYEVTTAEGAKAALDLLASGEKFDVIVCDFMMPDISGVRFYSTVCERYPELRDRFIFATGGVFTAEVNNFIDANKPRYLYKPFDTSDLEAELVGIVVEAEMK
jgi:signal transduction histidine kinase